MLSSKVVDPDMLPEKGLHESFLELLTSDTFGIFSATPFDYVKDKLKNKRESVLYVYIYCLREASKREQLSIKDLPR